MTGVAKEMLDSYPGELGRVDREALVRCIEECFACEQACSACADACLSEKMVADLAKCIRTNLDCADACSAAGRVLSRHTGHDAGITRALLETCATVCGACAEQCEGHAGMHDHCRVCAEACRRCEQACRALLAHMG